MSTQKLLRMLFFSCGLGACTIRIGPLDENAAPPASAPDEGSGADPPLALDAAQQARQEEADRYIAEVVYQGATVLYSTVLPSGDQLDFIDRNTLQSLPYPLPALPFGAGDLVLPPGVAYGLTELEQSAELLALAAMATPFHRPTFLPYVMGEAPDATSIEDYLQRYQVGGAPSGTHRLYAGLVSDKPTRGVSGYMSQFRPEVAPDSLSLMEFAVACPAEGPAQELVGVVISVDRVNGFGPKHEELPDTRPRMHIEYTRPQNGPNGYVWDGMDGTFVANPLRLHQPGEVVPYSVINEVSIEHLMAIFSIAHRRLVDCLQRRFTWLLSSGPVHADEKRRL